jgi:dUTP pyrophosphatase
MVRGFEAVEKEFRKNVDVIMPLRKTVKSAGYDFICPYDITVHARSNRLIWTDVKAYMQEDEVLKIYIRSSLAIKWGITLVNSTGIIDSDYFSNPSNDGNIGICLENKTLHSYLILKGEGIAQGVFQKYLIADNCNSDEERTGGIGSTNG